MISMLVREIVLSCLFIHSFVRSLLAHLSNYTFFIYSFVLLSLSLSLPNTKAHRQKLFLSGLHTKRGSSSYRSVKYSCTTTSTYAQTWLPRSNLVKNTSYSWAQKSNLTKSPIVKTRPQYSRLFAISVGYSLNTIVQTLFKTSPTNF